jgi:hypothetical protein
LNFLIPIFVWIFLAYILYKPFKEPIDKLWYKFQDWKENRGETEQPWENITKSIEYE